MNVAPRMSKSTIIEEIVRRYKQRKLAKILKLKRKLKRN